MQRDGWRGPTSFQPLGPRQSGSSTGSPRRSVRGRRPALRAETQDSQARGCDEVQGKGWPGTVVPATRSGRMG